MLLPGQANHAMPRETLLRKLMGTCFSCGTRAGDHGSARVLSPPPKTTATDNTQVRRRYIVHILVMLNLPTFYQLSEEYSEHNENLSLWKPLVGWE